MTTIIIVNNTEMYKMQDDRPSYHAYDANCVATPLHEVFNSDYESYSLDSIRQVCKGVIAIRKKNVFETGKRYA